MKIGGFSCGWQRTNLDLKLRLVNHGRQSIMKYPVLSLLCLLAFSPLTAQETGKGKEEAKAVEAKQWTLFDGKSLDDWQTVDIGGSAPLGAHHA